MAALIKLTEEEVQAIVDRVLGVRWRGIGYSHADVIAEDDVYGEPALSVTVWLKAESPVIPADLYSQSLLELRDALRTEGEDRYAYVHTGRPDDLVEDDHSDEP